MRPEERRRGLLRAPKLAWDLFVRGRYDYVYDQMPIRASGMSMAKRFSLARAGANMIHRRLTPWSMPLHLQVELTNYCELRCPVCPTGSKLLNRRPTTMDLATFEKLIDEVGPYLLTLSLWAWGEPLLHPDLEKILRAARKHNVTILLSTNGQRLNRDDVLNALIREPPTYLIVAIDGLSDETNSKYRVGAKLAPALDGVRRLADMKRKSGTNLPVLHMRYIVMKHNQHEVPRLQEFAASNGFELVTVRTLSIIDSSSSEQVHTELIPDSETWRAYDYENGKRVRREDYICQEPFWFPTVFADGSLVPCEQDYNGQQTIGVISEKVSFRELWYSKQAARVRKVIRDNAESLSFCCNCPYKDRPVTDCSIEAHYIDPDITPADLGSILTEQQRS